MTNAEARFNKSHIRKVYACLAVTCHLHFWQNDRDFLRATVVTRGWNGYRNKSQHRKSTLEKKILPPFQQGFEPATFQSRVRRSNHWAIPAPIVLVTYLFVYIDTCWAPHLEMSPKHFTTLTAQYGRFSEAGLHEWMPFVIFANSLSPPSIVKKVRTGSKSSQGT